MRAHSLEHDRIALQILRLLCRELFEDSIAGCKDRVWATTGQVGSHTCLCSQAREGIQTCKRLNFRHGICRRRRCWTCISPGHRLRQQRKERDNAHEHAVDAKSHCVPCTWLSSVAVMQKPVESAKFEVLGMHLSRRSRITICVTRGLVSFDPK